MDFGKLADNIALVFDRLMGACERHFPGVFSRKPIELKWKEPQRGSAPIVSRRSGRTGERAAPIVEYRYTFLNVTRTERGWRRDALTADDAKHLRPLTELVRRAAATRERFCVLPLAWTMKKTSDRSTSHVMPLIIDTERAAGERALHATVVDVNGVGLARDRYSAHIAKEVYPAGGPNVLLNVILKKVMAHVAAELRMATSSVDFPAFQNLNLGGDDFSREDAEHGLHVAKGAQDGICAVATLFLIVLLVCEQRRVTRVGMRDVLKAYISTDTYEHYVFTRSFTYALLKRLDLATPQCGVSGHEVTLDRARLAR
jgi:hypothetical protein